LAFTGAVDLGNQTASLNTIKGNLGTIHFSGNIIATDLDSSPALTGKLEIDSSNLLSTLNKLAGTEISTTNPDVLKKITATTNFAATADNLSLDDLKLTLDSTEFQGNLRLRMSAPRNLYAAIQGTHLNLDHYQAPPAENDKKAGNNAANDNAALFAPLLAPLAILEGGKGNIYLSLETLIANGIAITAPEFSLQANGKQVNIHDLKLGVFGGQVSADIAANLAGAKPRLTFNKQVSNIDIQQAQRQFSDNAHLSGSLTMTVSGTSQGDTATDLMNNLSAAGNLQIENLHLASVNLEQSYCELAALVEKPPAREEPWPKGTNLNTLTSTFQFDNAELQLNNYATGVGNLTVRGNGTINIDRENFNLRVISNLQGERTSASGCEVKSTRVRNKDIPLICKDSFAKAGASSCKPDPDFLKQLLQQELMDRFIDKDGEESDKSKAVRGLLKGIFGN